MVSLYQPEETKQTITALWVTEHKQTSTTGQSRGCSAAVAEQSMLDEQPDIAQFQETIKFLYKGVYNNPFIFTSNLSSVAP